MPPIALLSDVHSNLPALKAVLADVTACGAEGVVFLGDIVGYGASPAECVDLVRKHGGCCVMGNHDAAMARMRAPEYRCAIAGWEHDGFLAGLVHSARQLEEDQAAWIASLPYRLEVPGALVAHGSLDDPKEFHYITDAETAVPTLDLLEQTTGKVGFFGHTHLQDVFLAGGEEADWIDGMRFRLRPDLAGAVMVGSVGLPRDEVDRRACWTLWHPEERIVEFRKVQYDRMKAACDMLEAGLPMESAMHMLHSGEEAFLPRRVRN